MTWEPGVPQRRDDRSELEATMETRAWRWIAVLALVVVLVGGLLFVLYAANIAD